MGQLSLKNFRVNNLTIHGNVVFGLTFPPRDPLHFYSITWAGFITY